MANLHLQIMVTCLALTSGIANSAESNASLMEAITNNVRAVCQFPSDQGKHWTVNAKGDGSVTIDLKLAKLANLNTKGEAEFTKEEWEGVQQVLKEQQSDDNKDYRACARELTPKFLEKFSTSLDASNNGVDSEVPKNGSVKVIQNSSGEKSPPIHSNRDVNINIK